MKGMGVGDDGDAGGLGCGLVPDGLDAAGRAVDVEAVDGFHSKDPDDPQIFRRST